MRHWRNSLGAISGKTDAPPKKWSTLNLKGAKNPNGRPPHWEVQQSARTGVRLKGPKHVVKTGKTIVQTGEQAREPPDRIFASHDNEL